MNDKDFTELRRWIRAEMDAPERMWSQARLAERAELSQTQVSRVLSGEIPVTYNFCLSIAKAFRVPPRAVLAKAGLLEQLKPDEILPELEQINMELLQFSRFEQLAIVNSFQATMMAFQAARQARQAARP